MAKVISAHAHATAVLYPNSGWISCNAGYYATWPGLTAAKVRKYLPNKIEETVNRASIAFACLQAASKKLPRASQTATRALPGSPQRVPEASKSRPRALQRPLGSLQGVPRGLQEPSKSLPGTLRTPKTAPRSPKGRPRGLQEAIWTSHRGLQESIFDPP